ncbi:MAG TPA: Holliday junction branch migration protein RuvA [Candidatus Woesebacteria bacterium]|nr:Holliday junction branch migration protein RuvA [Candidatus Woesebacteria bacterium]
MISSLKGTISSLGGDRVEVEINGVGYEVFGKFSHNNYEIGQEVKLFTYMAVSENDIRLFGFENNEDLNLFKMLITVSGVGPKTASQILGETNGGAIIKAIGEADVEFFKKLKGVGLKTAQRIIVDLKSKVGGLGELDLKEEKTIDDDLVLSLQQLGFEKKEIETMIKGLPKELVAVEDKLEWCLKNR